VSDQFVAEIRAFPFNFAPKGWAQCNGQLLPISQNTAVFSLLGTNFGGDGKSTFGLPNLQGAMPKDFGQGAVLTIYDLGESGGEQTVTLLTTQIPTHGHNLNVAGAGNSSTPSASTVLAGGSRGKPSAYASGPPTVAMSAAAVATAGSSVPHNNMSPYVTLNFCIALTGIFPPRS
jgi:microcystin-dependent protein